MPSTTSTPERHNDPNGSLIDNLRLAIIIIALFILAIVLSLSIIGLYRRRQARARNNVNLELDDVRRGAAYTGDGRRWYGNRRADRDANSRAASATMSRILARFKPQPQRDRERMRMDSVTGTRASAAENHELQTLQQSSNRRIWPGAQPNTPFQGQNLYNERLENPFRVRTTNAVLSQTLLQDEATQSAHQSQNRDPLLPSYAECTRQQTAIHGPNGRADMVGQSLESIMEPRGVGLQAVQPHPR